MTKLNDGVCKQCGNEFRSRNKRFCSSECQTKYRNINPPPPKKLEYICENCGNPFNELYSKVKRRSEIGTFCSNQCRSEYKKTHKTESKKRECICKTCGKIFNSFPSNIKPGASKYCSRQCTFIGNTKKEIVKCVTCENEFETIPYKLENGSGKYCSRECYFNSKGSKIDVTCEVCGKQFKKSETNINRTGHNYCSQKCYGAIIGVKNKTHEMREKVSNAKKEHFRKLHESTGKIGDMYDTVDWLKLSKNFRKKFPFCALCGKTKNLAVHHIFPYRFSQTNDGKNLVTLCQKCHGTVESITNKLIIETGDYKTTCYIMRMELYIYRQQKIEILKQLITEGKTSGQHKISPSVK